MGKKKKTLYVKEKGRKAKGKKKVCMFS